MLMVLKIRDTCIIIAVVISAPHHHRRCGQSQIHALPDIAIAVDIPSRVRPDRSQGRLEALALRNLSYPVESRHRSILGQALVMGCESRLGCIPRHCSGPRGRELLIAGLGGKHFTRHSIISPDVYCSRDKQMICVTDR